MDAADEAIYRKVTEQLDKSGPISRSSSLTTTTVPSLYYDSDSSSSSSTKSMTGQTSAGMEWLNEEPKLDLALHDYHSAIAQTASRQAQLDKQLEKDPRKRSSSRSRTRSLTSLRRPSLSGLRRDDSSPPLPKKSRARTYSLRSHIDKPRPQTSHSTIEPAAKFYQEPEARLKLRTYLATPHKFDEVLEFGFPSVKEDQRPVTHPKMSDEPLEHNRSGRPWFSRPNLCKRQSFNPNWTFFLDDSTPDLTADEDDKDDHLALEAPLTPTDESFGSRKASIATQASEMSPRRIFARPSTAKSKKEPYIQALNTDREMTLHLTLTKPELRSPWEPDSARRLNQQPLERTSLSTLGDAQSSWGSVASEQSRMSRFFRKIGIRT